MNEHADKTQEQKSQLLADEVSRTPGGGAVSAFQLIDNRPEAAAQRKLQEKANNSPQAKWAGQLQSIADDYAARRQAIQRKADPAEKSDKSVENTLRVSAPSATGVQAVTNSILPPIQRAPVPTVIRGRTHLVKLLGGSIYEGEEIKGGELEDGEPIEVDPEDAILSRRGPNQEIFGEMDRVGEQTYTWVRVVKIKGEMVKEAVYVREDALDHRFDWADEAPTLDKRERLGGYKGIPFGKPFKVEDLHQLMGKRGKTKNIRERLDDLVGKGFMIKRDAANPNDETYQCLPGIEDVLRRQADVDQLNEERRRQATSVERPERVDGPLKQPLLDGLQNAILTFTDAAPNIHELTEAVKTKEVIAPVDKPSGSAYRNIHSLPGRVFSDWFDEFANILSLLVHRTDLSEAAMTRLLKFELMRFQLQAPYGKEDMDSIKRQTSPLVSSDYARGMKTPLWNAVNEVKLQMLRRHLLSQGGPKGYEKTVSQELNKCIIVSASSAFSIKQLIPVEISRQNLQLQTIQQNTCLFLPDFKLQLVKAKELGKDFNIDSYMGGRGLRSSPSQSAGMLAAHIAQMVKQGNVKGALEQIKGSFSKDFDVQKEDKTVNPLDLVNYHARHQIVLAEHDEQTGRWRDPLLTSNSQQLGELKEAFDYFGGLLSRKGLPFLVTNNIKVIVNMVHGEILNFFNAQTPSVIMSTIIDALHEAAECALFLESSPDFQASVRNSARLELFYQQMQILHEAIRFQLNWKGSGGILDQALRGMLPEDAAAKPTATYAAPHGLAMIDQINNALGRPTDVGVLKSSYYETPGIFEKQETVDTTANETLLSKSLIVLEPHPNNAEDRNVHPHNPFELLQMIARKGSTHTVLMDVTLNHLGEREISEILKQAQPLIEAGRLNLIFLQSGTKFLQHGMDIVGVGTSMVFNNGAGNWEAFNRKMEETRHSVPEDDEAYMARMMSANKEALGDYLNRIRENTAYLKKVLFEQLAGQQPNAFEITFSGDPQTVYVAIAPTSGFVQLCVKKNPDKFAPDKPATDLEKSKNLVMMHTFHDLLAKLRGTPIVKRPSFGFNLTNLGECITTIRITPGVEEPELFLEYAKAFASIGRGLYDRMEKDAETYESMPRSEPFSNTSQVSISSSSVSGLSSSSSVSGGSGSTGPNVSDSPPPAIMSRIATAPLRRFLSELSPYWTVAPEFRNAPRPTPPPSEGVMAGEVRPEHSFAMPLSSSSKESSQLSGRRLQVHVNTGNRALCFIYAVVMGLTGAEEKAVRQIVEYIAAKAAAGDGWIAFDGSTAGRVIAQLEAFFGTALDIVEIQQGADGPIISGRMGTAGGTPVVIRNNGAHYDAFIPG